MLRFETTAGDWQIEVWSERTPAPHATQDAWLVDPRSGALRLAVVDGCTPMAGSAETVSVDSAIWAASVVRCALHSWRPAEECLLAANAFLCDLGVEITQARSQAAAVVADLGEDRLELACAMDCEAWLEGDDGWRQAFPEERLRSDVLAAYEQWKRAHPEASQDELNQFEEELLSSPEAWRTTSVGRFPEPRLLSASLPLPRSLVLASDGARLSAERLPALEQWLAGLREWEERHVGRVAGGKTHDDVTVLRATCRDR